MAEEWTHVRIRKRTLAALKEFIRSLQRGLEQGHEVVEIGRDDVPTLDAAIRVLLNRDYTHKERVKKSRRGKRQHDLNVHNITTDATT